MARESFGTIVKRRMYGVLFIVVVAGLVTLSFAIYNKVFTPTTDITIAFDHTGNELLVDSDVKERGIIGALSALVASTHEKARERACHSSMMGAWHGGAEPHKAPVHCCVEASSPSQSPACSCPLLQSSVSDVVSHVKQ